MYYTIVDIEILHNHTVLLRFADATEATVDLDPYLDGPAFTAIREDPTVFASVSVDAEVGTIVWPNGADLAPDALYEDCRSARMESAAQTS